MQGVVVSLAQQLIKHRRYNYSQEQLEHFLLINSQVISTPHKIINKKGFNLDALILKSRSSSSKVCILYAHGLGSNKMESLFMAKQFLKEDIDVCCFDFSGSGRSQGNLTTYGIYEQEDIMTMHTYLQNSFKYERYVLWGRSMGAVSVVLAMSKYGFPKVDCLVLDSPFCSFAQVAVQTAARKSIVPKFMLSLLTDPLQKHIYEKTGINPFEIDIGPPISKIDIKIMLIYSHNDSIVSSAHSKQLISQCKRSPAEIQIEQDHNKQRSKSTIAKIYTFIREAMNNNLRRASFSKFKNNRGISVTSMQSRERDSIKSCSKIKLTQGRNTATKNDFSLRTIGPFNESTEFAKRIETEASPVRKRLMAISSLCMQGRKTYINQFNKQNVQNKENIRPTLNMMRKNRFR